MSSDQFIVNLNYLNMNLAKGIDMYTFLVHIFGPIKIN